MYVLKPDLLDLYVYLNRQVSAEKRWLVFNKVLVFQDKEKLKSYVQYNDAKRFACQSNSLTKKYAITSLIPLYKTITGVLLLKSIPPYINTNNYINLLNFKVMNAKNLEYLKDSLKYLGFGDKLNQDLEKNMKEQKTEFYLKTEIPHFNSKMDYTLHFKKSNQSEMYFFNSYHAELKNEKLEQTKAQSFYINKGNGITAKEAFNLLEGRSVYKELFNKEGNKYNAWLKLDSNNIDQLGNHKVRQFTDQYGYNLEKTLAAFPIKELADQDQKKQLLQSLEKGNIQQVTIRQADKESKYYVEAVPQFKNINVYDQKMHLVKNQSIQELGQSRTQNEKPTKKQEQKTEGEAEQPKQQQTRKRKMTV